MLAQLTVAAGSAGAMTAVRTPRHHTTVNRARALPEGVVTGPARQVACRQGLVDLCQHRGRHEPAPPSCSVHPKAEIELAHSRRWPPPKSWPVCPCAVSSLGPLTASRAAAAAELCLCSALSSSRAGPRAS